MIDAHRMLVEAGLLPEDMPNNYTFNKVRKILPELNEAAPQEFNEAIAKALKLEVLSPLVALIFIKHHLLGEHGAEIDRVEKNEETGTSYAILIYPEGELPLNLKYLRGDIREGVRVSYDPVKGEYTRE